MKQLFSTGSKNGDAHFHAGWICGFIADMSMILDCCRSPPTRPQPQFNTGHSDSGDSGPQAVNRSKNLGCSQYLELLEQVLVSVLEEAGDLEVLKQLPNKSPGHRQVEHVVPVRGLNAFEVTM